MKDKFASFAKTAVKKADSAFNSPKAKEAKRMGKEVWGVAKVALGSAIKTAKDVIDKKQLKIETKRIFLNNKEKIEIKRLAQELKKYQNSEHNFKDYFESMKLINTWLKTQEKE